VLQVKNNLQVIESKYVRILNEQDNSEDVSYYTGTMLLLTGLLVIILLGIFIKDNYSARLLVFVAILLVSLILYKSRISKSLPISNKQSNQDEPTSQMKQKLTQLQQTLGSRQTRVAAVEWFYKINFPVFLFSIKEFISGPMSQIFLLVSLSISFLIGLFIWKLYFKSERNKIATHQLTVSQMISDLG